MLPNIFINSNIIIIIPIMMMITLLLCPANAFLTSHSATFNLNSGFRSFSCTTIVSINMVARMMMARITSIFFCSAGRALIL